MPAAPPHPKEDDRLASLATYPVADGPDPGMQALVEAAASLAEWGVLVRSPARLMTLRNHLRSLLEAQTPGGHRIKLDWMDPELLPALLPLFGPSELSAFFGSTQSLVVTGTQAWHHAALEQGRLTQINVPLAQGA